MVIHEQSILTNGADQIAGVARKIAEGGICGEVEEGKTRGGMMKQGRAVAYGVLSSGPSSGCREEDQTRGQRRGHSINLWRIHCNGYSPIRRLLADSTNL